MLRKVEKGFYLNELEGEFGAITTPIFATTKKMAEKEVKKIREYVKGSFFHDRRRSIENCGGG